MCPFGRCAVKAHPTSDTLSRDQSWSQNAARPSSYRFITSPRFTWGQNAPVARFEWRRPLRQRNGKNGTRLRAWQSLTIGALAQLGERLICIQEVRSSILLGSTKLGGGSRTAALPSGLHPRHMPQKGPLDLFVRQSRNGMWVGSSGG